MHTIPLLTWYSDEMTLVNGAINRLASKSEQDRSMHVAFCCLRTETVVQLRPSCA